MPVDEISSPEFLAIFKHGTEAVIVNSQYLSELDMIGDSDFGVNISNAFQKVLQELEGLQNPDIGQILKTAGDVFVYDVGATIGGLLGRSFQRAGREMQGERTLSSNDLIRIMKTILSTIVEIGAANPGDKTLIDALQPAVNAGSAAAQAGSGDIRSLLSEMAIAAENGAKETKNMVSRVGRSSYLGERSRGTVDVGAKMISILLNAMSDFCKNNVGR